MMESTRTFPRELAAFMVNEWRGGDGVLPVQLAALLHWKMAGRIDHAMMVGTYRELAGRPGRPVVPKTADRDAIAVWIAEARAAFPNAKPGFLVGQVVKLSAGTAEPRVVKELVEAT